MESTNAATTFWKALLDAALTASLQGAATVKANNGSLQSVGIGAGVTGLMGVLQFVLAHPMTQQAATQAAIQQAAQPRTPPPAPVAGQA